MQIVLERPGPVALTLDRPEPQSIMLDRPAPVSIVLHLVGDRPDTGGGTSTTVTAAQRFAGMMQGASAGAVIFGMANQSSRSVSQTAQAGVIITCGTSQVSGRVGQAASCSAVTQVSAVQANGKMPQAANANSVAGAAASQVSQSTTQSATISAGGNLATATAAQVAGGVAQFASMSVVIQVQATQTAAGDGQAASASVANSALASSIFAASLQAASASLVSAAGAISISARAAQSASASIATVAIASNVAAAMSQSAIAGIAVSAVASQSAGKMNQGASAAVLWSPANLTVAPLVIMDAATLTWSGSNFSSGTNSGSLGGSFTSALGTPTKAAADINGFDAIAFAANSGIKRASVATPASNRTLFYVSKRTGNPPGGVFLGAIMTQSATTPGWSFFDEINVSTTPGGGHAVVPGDVGGIGWPTGTTTINKDVVAHPTTDDGTYHINAAKIGTAHFWRYDGTALTPTGSSDSAMGAVTTDLTIGTSAVGQNFNGNIAYTALLEDPTATEVEKLEGWAAWKYGLTSKLASGHPYKSAPPTV